MTNTLTASHVATALTASHVATALPASYVATALTASHVATALTASHVATALTASHVATALTASHVATAASHANSFAQCRIHTRYDAYRVLRDGCVTATRRLRDGYVTATREAHLEPRGELLGVAALEEVCLRRREQLECVVAIEERRVYRAHAHVLRP